MEEEKEEEKKALFLVSIYDNAHCHFSFFLGAVFSSCGMFYRHLGLLEQRTRTQGAESDQGVKKEKIKEKETKQEKKIKIKIVMKKKKKKQVCFVGFFCTGFSTFQFFIFYFIFFHLLQDAAGGYRPPPQFLGPFSSPQFFFHLFFLF